MYWNCLDCKRYNSIEKIFYDGDYKTNCEISAVFLWSVITFYYILYIFALYSRPIASALCHDIRYNITNLPIIFVKVIVASILSRNAWLLRNFAEMDGYKSSPLAMNFNVLSRKSFHWSSTRPLITLLHRNECYCIRSKQQRYEITRRGVLRQSYLCTRRRNVRFSESRWT